MRLGHLGSTSGSPDVRRCVGWSRVRFARHARQGICRSGAAAANVPGSRSGATPTAATRNALGPPTSGSPAGARRAARSSGAPPTGAGPTRATCPPRKLRTSCASYWFTRPANRRTRATSAIRTARSSRPVTHGLTTSSTRRRSVHRPCATTATPWAVPPARVRREHPAADDRHAPHRRLPRAPAHRGRALASHDPEVPCPALLDPQARQAQGLDRRQPRRGRRAGHRPAHGRLQGPVPRRGPHRRARRRLRALRRDLRHRAFTGLRMGELRALRWLDVDFANRIVHVRRNHVRDPTAPLSPSACAASP